MSTLTTIIIIGAIASVCASSLTIAVAMLSSRISQRECLIERFEQEEATPSLLPKPYTMKG